MIKIETVQQQCLPPALMGHDLLCQAQSGMGKTAVFVLAILNQLDLKDATKVKAQILCHSRDLAYQINKEFVRLGKYLPTIKSTVVIGGDPFDKQKTEIETSKPAIIVGTPGRTKDLLNKKVYSLDALQFFVIDECDKVISMLGKLIQKRNNQHYSP